MSAVNEPFTFLGHGANVVGSLGSGSLVQDMPSAMQLNGTNAYASGSTTMSTVTGSTATVAMWVYYTGSQNPDGEYVLFSDSTSESRKILMQTRKYSSHGASFRFGYVDSAGGGHPAKDTGGTSGVITSGAWTHVALTANGSSVGLYINGEFRSDASFTSGHSYAIANPHLGRAAFSDGRYFPGYIRDVQVYNVSSTTTQLGQIMNGELPHGTPIHWWTCDDGATNDDGSATDSDLTLTNTVEDKSFYNLNQIGAGSVSGSVTVSGGTWNLLNSTYVNFDGTGDYIDIGDKANLEVNAFTVGGWYYIDSTKSGADFLVCNSDGGTKGWRLYTYNDDLNFYRATSSVVVDISGWKDQWIHIVGSYTSGYLKLYINGVLQGTNNPTGSPDYAGAAFQIGADGAGSDTFKGKMSDVIFYDSVLTSAQIDLLFKGQWVGSPLGYWPMNDGTGDAVDTGTGGNNGTLTNATWVKPDFTGDGPQLKAGTTMSAPQGRYYLKYFAATAPEKDWNQHADATFLHNSGTVTWASGDSGVYDATTAGPFYDITNDESTTMNIRNNAKMIVENNLFMTAGYLVMTNNSTLEMGTTSSAGIISSSAVYAYLRGGAGTGTVNISGASQVYPSIWKGTMPLDIDWRGKYASSAGISNFNFKNLDIQSDITLTSGTNTSGHERAAAFTSVGNVSYAALSIGAGCIVSASSYDFTTTGTLAVEGTFTGGSGLHNINNINGNFSTTDLRLSSGITYINGGGSSALSLTSAMSNLSFASGTLVFNQSDGNQRFEFNKAPGSNAKRMGTVVFNNGSSNYTYIGAVGWSAYRAPHDDVIILSNDNSNGFLTQNLDMGMDGSLKIAADAKINAGSSTLTMGENFNMAGGFIGRNALDLDGVDEEVEGTTTYATTGATSCCIEGWVNPTAIAAGNHYFYRMGDFFAGLSEATPDKWYVGWELEDGAGNRDYPGILYEDATLVDGKWHHFAMTWASGTSLLTSGNQDLNFYIDGKKVAEDYSNTSADVPATVVRPRAIGRNWKMGNSHTGGGETHWYDGKIARLSVWYDLPLTEAQIRDMMFYNWADVSGSSIDQTKCVQWYEFNDSVDATTVSDMSGSGNTGTLTSTDGWAGAGTFDEGTSTVKMVGTGEIKARSTTFYDLHVADAAGDVTTLTGYRNGDDMNIDGTVYLNSGTVQYGSEYVDFKMRGANPFVKQGTADFSNISNIGMFGSAATPEVTTQTIPAMTWENCWYRVQNANFSGDQTLNNDLRLDVSGTNVFTKGYDITLNELEQFQTGSSVVGEAGTTFNFLHANGLNSSTKGSFITSGEAAYQATTDAGGNNTEGVYTNTEVFASGTSQMSVSYWIRIPSDSDFFDDSLLRCVWGFGAIFTGTPTVATHPGMWAHTIQSSWIKNDLYTYDAPGTSDSEFYRLHDSATKPADWTGTGPYGWHHICTTIASGSGADKMITYVDGVEVDKATKTKEFLTVGTSTHGLSVHGAHINDNLSSYGTQMSIADFRVYKDITLTSGNTVTLASENPATSVSGAYADPDNALGATLWWKLNATPSGTLDTTDSAGSNDGTAYGGAKSGFVTVTGAANFNLSRDAADFNVQTQLTNTYISGSTDIVIPVSGTVLTKGTVVLD